MAQRQDQKLKLVGRTLGRRPAHTGDDPHGLVGNDTQKITCERAAVRRPDIEETFVLSSRPKAAQTRVPAIRNGCPAVSSNDRMNVSASTRRMAPGSISPRSGAGAPSAPQVPVFEQFSDRRMFHRRPLFHCGRARRLGLSAFGTGPARRVRYRSDRAGRVPAVGRRTRGEFRSIPALALKSRSWWQRRPASPSVVTPHAHGAAHGCQPIEKEFQNLRGDEGM